ncbi:hypothetical protein [Vibrio parahaemolyticus]|uniref:hypothetical protein n=1 Tax=Vibrio parahaemolyticus TaxID=670 RepID=UPI0011F05B92|nr:hypothetical protein [Vibrio parahaemolyticus]KAB5597902.1 hypothetical protein F0578_19125 [Vibrio parahaemolyticus]
MNNIYIVCIILVFIYSIWCFFSARASLNKVATELDNYLQTDHPDLFKSLLIALFDSSLKHTLAYQLFASSVFGLKRTAPTLSSTRLVKEYQTLTTEQKNAFSRLLLSILLVNFRLCPITYFVFALIFIVIWTLRSLLNQSEKIIDQLLGTKEQVIDDIGAWYINRII